VEQVEQDECHVPARPLPFREHRLNTLVAVPGARLTVKDGGTEGPRNLTSQAMPACSSKSSPRRL